MTTHIIGLDLGQSIDYSALAVLHRVWTWPGHVRGEPFDAATAKLRHEIPFLLRWALGTPYPAIVQNVAECVKRVAEDHACDQVMLVVDQGGPGRPVVDLLRRERIRLVGLTITGGQTVGEHDEDLSVPKREIASALVVAAQSGLLKVAAGLDLARDFEEELGAFGYEINRKTGKATYESQMAEVHDDLVMAAAIALWFSTSRLPQRWAGGAGSDLGDLDYSPLARR